MVALAETEIEIDTTEERRREQKRGEKGMQEMVKRRVVVSQIRSTGVRGEGGWMQKIQNSKKTETNLKYRKTKYGCGCGCGCGYSQRLGGHHPLGKAVERPTGRQHHHLAQVRAGNLLPALLGGAVGTHALPAGLLRTHTHCWLMLN